jgi:hypothetical protein
MSSDQPPPAPAPSGNGPATSSGAQQAAAGLPPVAPPSGKFIIQLFVVPGLIVGLIVVLLLGVNWIFSGPSSPEAFLKKLDDPNPDIRWRAAADLAQLLPRDDNLATNAGFALALAERMEKVLTSSESAELDVARRLDGKKLSEEDKVRERARVQADRDFILFMSGCLGNFIVPVTAPVLQRLAEEEPKIEPSALAARRQRALWNLAVLGGNLQRFDRMSPAQKDWILERLEEASMNTEHRDWCEVALRHLRGRRDGKPDAVGMADTLDRCSEAGDPILRERTAFCSKFWVGTDAENEKIEDMLLRLAADDGHGSDLTEKLYGEDPSGFKEILKRPGFIVQANAALALAYRGSLKTPLNLFKEMLDEEGLKLMMRWKAKDGKETAAEDKVLNLLRMALKDLGKLHEKAPSVDLSELRPLIDTLSKHPDAEVRTNAKSLQAALDK